LAEEDVVIVLNHYFSVMLEIIHKYRGTMLEFLGDGILAIFGAPVHYDDHVDSAIACALEMQITMEAVNEWNIRNGYPRMEMGVGINSGETIVGNIGAPHSMKYNVIGNTVNLASRIETFSTGGQVLISENSFQAARTKLHLGQTLQVSPKGVKTPVTVYQITGIDAPYFLELEDEDAALTELPEPAALVCYRVKDKQVDAKPLQHYMLSVSATKAVIIARRDEESLEVFENIKMLNSTGAEAFAKVVKKTDKGVILVSFTTSANDFSALAGA
jgi:adenylate cyclase